MHTFGPKPHLLTKYHIGSSYVIHRIWPLLAFDLHEGYSHPKLASAALPTKFGSIVYPIWPLMTFDLHQGHHHSQLASALLLTKYGSYSTYFTPFDLWWRSTSIKVIIILSLHQGFFWQNMVAIALSLPHLTSDDLWPPSRSSSFSACIRASFDQIW